MRVSRRLGFTLVELLVVIAIIGILIALLLPAVQAAREAARRSQCSNNLKQIALACHNYVDTHKVLPAGAYCGVTGTSAIAHCHTWIESLLPFFEQQAFYDQIDFRVGNHIAPNPSVLNNWMVGVLMCPSDPDRGLRPNSREKGYLPDPNGAGESLGASYVPCAGPIYMNACAGGRTVNQPVSPSPYCVQLSPHGDRGNGDSPGMFTGGYKTYSLANCSDGTSNTFLLGETLPFYSTFHMYFSSHMQIGNTTAPPNFHKVWTACPKSDTRIDTCYSHMGGYMSQHPGGAQMAMADGSVQFFSETIDYPTWVYLGGKEDGQQVAF